jgi:MFS family permease
VVAIVAAIGYATAGLAATLPARDDFGPSLRRPWTDLGREVRAVVSEARDGAGYLWSRRQARDALLAVNGSRLCYGFVFVTLLLVLKHGSGGTNATRGLASIGAVGTGLVIGTVIAAVVTPRWVRRTNRATVIASALGLAGLAVAILCPWLESTLFVFTAVVIGFATQAAKICSDAVIQTSVDDEHRGRAFAIVDMTFNVSYVAAAGIAAAVLPENAHSRAGLITAGLLWSAVGVGYRVAVRKSVPA